MKVTDAMVSRFLGWKLPKDFSPDCGIAFKAVYNETSSFGPSTHEPVGTNLFSAEQARAMLEHVLATEQGQRREPPFDGEPCPFCPSELRNFHAVAHNLLNRYDEWKQFGYEFSRVQEYMGELRSAVAATKPLIDAHFADRKHSHGVGS